MSVRALTMRSAVAAAAMIAALALAGCTLTITTPSPSTPADAPTSTAPSAPVASLVPLPTDALLSLTATATAPNGAIGTVTVIAHAPVAANDPAAAAARARLLAWCVDEMDGTILDDQGYSFTTVDVSLVPTSGTWPADLALSVYPRADSDRQDVLAASGGATQIDPRAADGTAGDYTPHCLQPAVLTGATTGTLYFAGHGDTSGTAGHPALSEWTNADFGVTATLPTGKTDSGVRFSDCSVTVTALGSATIDPDHGWAQDFTPTSCLVGGGKH